VNAQRQRPYVLDAELHQLKQLLACVVDMIVVEGRDHIQPYYFVPVFLQCSLHAEAKGTL
jgi:hypothetical protein